MDLPSTNVYLLTGSLDGALAVVALLVLPIVLERLKKNDTGGIMMFLWFSDFAFMSTAFSIVPITLALTALDPKGLADLLPTVQQVAANAFAGTVFLGAFVILWVTMFASGTFQRFLAPFRLLPATFGFSLFSLLLVYERTKDTKYLEILMLFSIVAGTSLLLYACITLFQMRIGSEEDGLIDRWLKSIAGKVEAPEDRPLSPKWQNLADIILASNASNEHKRESLQKITRMDAVDRERENVGREFRKRLFWSSVYLAVLCALGAWLSPPPYGVLWHALANVIGAITIGAMALGFLLKLPFLRGRAAS